MFDFAKIQWSIRKSLLLNITNTSYLHQAVCSKEKDTQNMYKQLIVSKSIFKKLFMTCILAETTYNAHPSNIIAT